MRPLRIDGAGANVVAAGRRKDRLDELTAAIEKTGGQALDMQTDVSDFAQVEALIARARERFGRLAAAFRDVTLEEFRRLMDVNFWGVVHGCRAALPIMMEQQRGVIINVASIMGKRGMPFSTAYRASKFAVVGFSEALRTELAASNVAVSVACPGAVESEIWQAAGNRLRGQLPEFPKYPASQLAQVIVNDARWPQPEIMLSLDAQAIDFFNSFAPRLMDWTLAAAAPFMQALQGSRAARPAICSSHGGTSRAPAAGPHSPSSLPISDIAQSAIWDGERGDRARHGSDGAGLPALASERFTPQQG